MKLVFFSKPFQGLSIPELSAEAHRLGFEGYDLCCRAGHPVNPDNVAAALPDAARHLKAEGLALPMVTGPTDLTEASQPAAERILAGMQAAAVPLLKLGYFLIDNRTQDYWVRVDEVRRQLEAWSKLAGRYGVRVCYHTHSGAQCMGLSAAAMMHLVNGLDPGTVGVYLDPGHLLLDGESPDIAFNMVRKYLAAVALKDTAKTPNPVGEGWAYTFCRAGFGNVDWTAVFENLERVEFDGPLSVHGEYEQHYPPEPDGTRPAYVESLRDEFRFFRHRLRD